MKDPMLVNKVVLKNGGTIETEAGTAIVAVSAAGTATLTGTETIVASELAIAEGNVLVGNSSGVGVALNAKTSGRIMVGDGTTIASVAVSGDATLAANGAVTVASGAITRTKMSTAAASKCQMASPATVATTGNTDEYVIVAESGTITGVDFSCVDALAAHDTNFVTFQIVNLGQAGAGTAAVLAATDANTTKATGGTALSANTKRSLSLTATGADLVVVAGDRLKVRCAANGTLANTLTFPTFLIRIGGTT